MTTAINPIRKAKKINISTIQEQINAKSLESFNKAGYPEENFENNAESWIKLKSDLCEAVEECMEYKDSKQNKKRPWWTEAIEDAVKKESEAFRLWMKE